MFLDIQELRTFTKIYDWTKLTIKILSQIFEKVPVFGLDYF